MTQKDNLKCLCTRLLSVQFAFLSKTFFYRRLDRELNEPLKNVFRVCVDLHVSFYLLDVNVRKVLKYTLGLIFMPGVFYGTSCFRE